MNFRVIKISKNTGTHTPRVAFYNRIQTVNKEENNVFRKINVVHTRDMNHEGALVQKKEHGAKQVFLWLKCRKM